MRQEHFLYQTTLSELKDVVGNIVEEKLNGLQLPQLKQDPKFYTRIETAKILGITLPTLHAWTKSGEIQGTRIGTRVRYRVADVEAAVKNIKTTKGKRL